MATKPVSIKYANNANNRSVRGPISNRSVPLNVRYKGYKVVSASFNLLMTFLLRKLNWLSQQTNEQLSATTKWASTLLEVKGKYIPFYRDSIVEFCQQMTIMYPDSTTTYCIGGRNNIDAETGQTYMSVYWLNGPVKSRDNTNQTELPDATLYELLEQICLRLTKLSNAIEYSDIQGVVEVDALSELEYYLVFFDKIKNESESFSDQVKKFEKEFHANKTSTPSAPKKIILPNAMRQRIVVPHRPETPIKVIKPETVKPETAKPETAKPETAKPETVKPETVKPETAKPETAKPETEIESKMISGNG